MTGTFWESRLMASYPIELEIAGRTVVVVGLGAVGRRKAAGALRAGARVIGVDPAGFEGGALTGAEVVKEPYDRRHLFGASLAFAAATAAVNRRVVADARAAGIWVNAASGPDEGDFAVPAVWQDGLVVVAVSTSGASPALAAALRDRAATAIGPAAAELATLLAELRPLVLARNADPEARRRLLAAWGDAGWLERWEADGPEAVRTAILAMLNAAPEADLPG
jgi:siroheme synthase-like protein